MVEQLNGQINQIKQSKTLLQLEEAVNPLIGYYALFLADKGVDPTSKRGLEAVASFRQALMTYTIKDALNAFDGLAVSHSDLFTIYDIGFDNWKLEQSLPSLVKRPASGGDSDGKQ